MFREPKSPSRVAVDAPRDKPRADPVEHANLVRPSAKFHPQASSSWGQADSRLSAWRMR